MKSWESLRDALDDIVEDASEKPSIKAEAEGLSQNFRSLETAIMVVMWSDILERFEKTNKSLQRVNIDLTTVVQLYDTMMHSKLILSVCVIVLIITKQERKRYPNATNTRVKIGDAEGLFNSTRLTTMMRY